MVNLPICVVMTRPKFGVNVCSLSIAPSLTHNEAVIIILNCFTQMEGAAPLLANRHSPVIFVHLADLAVPSVYNASF